MTDGFPELLDIRNALYLGNYGLAVSRAATLQLQQESNADAMAQKEMERDILMYRAQIGLGQHDLVVSEIAKRVGNDDESPVALRAVRQLALYTGDSQEHPVDAIVEQLEEWLNNPAYMYDTTLAIATATIYANEGRHTDALRVVFNPLNLEMYSLKISSLLRLDRVDMAMQALKKMSSVNDDATITQLCSAYVALARGGEQNIRDAEFIFTDLMEKYGQQSSVTLSNGRALCRLHMGAYEEAERHLMNALGQRSNDPETLINLVVCSQHLNRSKDLIQRYIGQLKTTSANHLWVKNYVEQEKRFDALAAQFGSH